MRLYKALLHLYPSSFRKEYEEELVQVFVRRRSQAHNPLASTWIWLTALVDVVVNASGAQLGHSPPGLALHRSQLATRAGFCFDGDHRHWLGNRRANTAAFSVTDHALLRPLPFP